MPIKEDIDLIDYLKEKGISHEQLKVMIEEQVSTVLQEEDVDKEDGEISGEVEPEGESQEPEPTVPTFTITEVKDLIKLEVREALKTKRKTPSKGKIVDEEPESIRGRAVFSKNNFEVLV